MKHADYCVGLRRELPGMGCSCGATLGPRYEVDEAMLGPDWQAGKIGLQAFCRCLQQLCDTAGELVRVVPVLSSYNGARPAVDACGEPYNLPDGLWQRALERMPRSWVR